MALHSREISPKSRTLLLIGAIICIVVVAAAALLFLSACNTDAEPTNESANSAEELEATETQNFVSYNPEAIATIQDSAEGTSGDMYSHLWFISGTITNIDDNSEVITVMVDTSSDYSQYLMSEIYIDNSASPDGSIAYSVGDVVEIRFLPEPEEGLIKPTEMYAV